MAFQIKPDVGDRLSASQPVLKQNFQEVKTLVGVDHEDFDAAAANQGKHKKVNLRKQANHPATIGDEICLYNVNNKLYYKNQNVAAGTAGYDFTAAGLADPGWFKLPSGIIVKFGKSAATFGNGDATAPIIFGADVPTINTIVSVQLTLIGDAGSSGNIFFKTFNEVTHVVTGWFWKDGGVDLYFSYIAIGY